jgi:hypothetical protein
VFFSTAASSDAAAGSIPSSAISPSRSDFQFHFAVFGVWCSLATIEALRIVDSCFSCNNRSCSRCSS